MFIPQVGTLVVDTREKVGDIRTKLTEASVPFTATALKEADYVITDRNWVTLGLERKTVGDFLGSIADERLKPQLARCDRSYDLYGVIYEGHWGLDRMTDDHKLVTFHADVASDGGGKNVHFPKCRASKVRKTGWDVRSVWGMIFSVQKNAQGPMIWLPTPDQAGTVELLQMLLARATTRGW